MITRQPVTPTILSRLSMPRSITVVPTSRSMYEGGPERPPELVRALGLTARHHPLRVLHEHGPAGVRGRVGAEVVFVVVAHEDERSAGGVRRDPVVGAAERLPLLLGRGQVEARG